MVLGGACLDGDAEGALFLDVPCAVEEDHVASLEWTNEWRIEACTPKMGRDWHPVGHAAIYVDLEDAPGILVMGGVDRDSICGVDVASGTERVPTCWLQTGLWLCRFAEKRLAHLYQEPPEELELVAEGWGRQETEEGDLYEGQFVVGLRCGTGRCQYAHLNGGGTYEGDWRDDKRHGSGKWEGPGRDVFGECFYDGAWDKDLRHGNGVSRYEDGSKFEGEYRGDWRYYGTYWLANGDIYVGYFGEHGRHGEDAALACVIACASDDDGAARKFACFALGNAAFHSSDLYAALESGARPLCACLAGDADEKTRANAARSATRGAAWRGGVGR